MGYDPIGLRPATVEELAAQERAVPRHRRPGRRPLLIMLTTLALLVGGAGALALARTDRPTEPTQPYGQDAPFGVGYVDGFGEHSPKPTQRPSTRKPRPAPSSASASGVTAAATATATASAKPSTMDSPALLASQLNAVHWSRVSNGKFDTYIWVHNEGTSPVAWEVRVTLSQGATVTGSRAVNRTFVDGTWVLTSTKGNLGAGLVYLFRFSGTTGSTKFSLMSCSVNGSPCDPFR